MLSAQIPGAKRAPGERGDDRVEIGRIGSTALVALADGAGAASHGGYGAELAAASALESLRDQFDEDLEVPHEAVLARAMHDARMTLSVAAGPSPGGSSIELEDLATTLTLVIFGEHEVAVAAIGDGIQVARDSDGDLALVAMAQDSEVANQTNFLTGPDFSAHLEVEAWPAEGIESLLISSDGLDAHLIDRKDGGRWPLQTTVTSLLNAPVLQHWGPSEFESLLDSEVIRRHTNDDLSLVLIRRVAPPASGSRQVDGLVLTLAEEVRPGCRAWSVVGCANLLAVETDLGLPADRGVAPRRGQVWDRGQRYGPVNWPVARLDDGLVLVQRLPPRAALVGDALRGADVTERVAILDGARASVEALHTAGLSHGNLSPESFALYPDGTVVLWEPGAGMFEGVDQEAPASRDRAFVSSLATAIQTGGHRPPSGEAA